MSYHGKKLGVSWKEHCVFCPECRAWINAARSVHEKSDQVVQRELRNGRFQAHSGRASSGCLYVRKDQHQFIEDFTNYPNIRYKDLLDVSSMCDMTLSPVAEQGNDLIYDESDIPSLEWKRAAP